MMIGGGGSDCGRADHGIGITEAYDASFVEKGKLGSYGTELDFGHNGDSSSPRFRINSGYSLNLWIR